MKNAGWITLVGAGLLVGCPPTTACPAGQFWNGTACVDRTDTGPDTGMSDGGGDTPGDTGLCGGTCSGTTPFCRASDEMCVACLEATDCDGANNACVDGECLPCDSNDDCESLTAAQCNTGTNTCEACTGDAACMGRTGTEVCDSGECVECLVNSDCGPMEGCVPETHTCRAYTTASGRLCGDCVADAECPSGQLCIAMMYDDPATGAADPVFSGNRCLWRSDASGPGAPGGACSTVRPYVSTVSLTSVDGVTANMCSLAVSTCEAHDDFRMVDCMTLDAAGNARCGRDAVADGVCRRLDVASVLCTVYCVSDTDCRAGVMCDTGLTPGQCRL